MCKGPSGRKAGASKTFLALERKAWLSVPIWAGPGASRWRIPPAISARVELPNLPVRIPANPMPLVRQGGMPMTLLIASSASEGGKVGQGVHTPKEAVE